MILRLLIGFALVGVGAYMVIKTAVFVDFFGSVDWAEQHLGGGGTNLFFKLLGIVVVLVGFIVAFNLWNAFLGATIGAVLPAGR